MKTNSFAIAPLALATAVAFGAVAATSQARAAGTQAAPLSQSLSGAAKDAYTSAQILVNNSDFAGAFTKYEEAYALSKDPRLLFNMAVCARSMKSYARMQSLLVRYAREGDATMSADDRADVANALAAIRNLVGNVKLDVTEEGAAVTIDGVAAGTTPLAQPLTLDLGAHALGVTKPGFEPIGRTLEVVGGSQTAMALTLTPLAGHSGQLVVSADEGATIAVDSLPAVQGHFDARVAAGPHDVRVTAPGKAPYETQIVLHDGETRMVPVALESEHHHAPLWPWVVGGVAVAAGAVIGGIFLFKSDSAQAPLTGTYATVKFSAAWARR
jgi:hypothetical protein